MMVGVIDYSLIPCHPSKYFGKERMDVPRLLELKGTYTNLDFKSTYSSCRGLIPNIDGIYISRFWFCKDRRIPCLRYNFGILRPCDA